VDAQDLSVKRGLRPLGNKKRLAFVEGETCNASLALFGDRVSAECYCDAFIQYAHENPPPVVMETMVAYVPKIVLAEKYAFIYPYTGVGAHPEYQRWAQDAIRACNSVMRQHNSTAGEYAYIPSNVEVVLRWDILVPRDFDPDSTEAQELLTDPPDGGFRPMRVSISLSPTSSSKIGGCPSGGKGKGRVSTTPGGKD
jgi:hypothetical protein